MKTLNKEQKAMLKELTNHRGYKLLLELAEDFEEGVLKRLKTIDITNPKDLQILQKNQNYLKGVEDFIETIKSQTNVIGKKEF